MKFRRATTANSVVVVSAESSGTTIDVAIKPIPGAVPKLSFDDIVVNNKTKLRNDGDNVQSRKRQVFTVLSPNKTVICQQDQRRSGRHQSKKSTENVSPKRQKSRLSSSDNNNSITATLDREQLNNATPTSFVKKIQLIQIVERQEPTLTSETTTTTTEPKESQIIQCSDELSWEYPKVGLPSCECLKKHYTITKMQPDSHQYQLSSVINCGLLSLEDVIIPAICYHEERALRKCEKKIRQDCARVFDEAPTNNDALLISSTHNQRHEYIQRNSAVHAIIACRSFVKEFETTACLDVRAYRMDRETRFTQQLSNVKKQYALQEYKEKQQQCLQERAENRERSIKQRKAEKEKRKLDQKKNYYKNKEMWREVALLMTALSRLEREEKEWITIQHQLKKKEEELILMPRKPVEQQRSSSNNSGESNGCCAVDADVEETVRQAMEDISLSTSRINQTLRDVLQHAEETEAVRKEIYHKYTNEHQFHGYLFADNPKGLVRDFILHGI